MLSETVASLKTSKEGEYNKVYPHSWKTNVNALPMNIKQFLDRTLEGAYGWHFVPHKNMQWEKEDWYKDQTLYLTFELQQDLIQSKLSVTFN